MFAGEDFALSEIDDLAMMGEGAESVAEDEEEEEDDDSFSRMSALMRARQPESVPEIYEPPAPKPPGHRRGGWILLLVVLLLVLAASGATLFFMRDRLMDRWPKLAEFYEMVGVKTEQVVGFGLDFQEPKSERQTENGVEQLLIRGVILNTTDRTRKIPPLRLALMNGNALVQEKIIPPPQANLEGHKSVGFRFTVEQPDPTANHFIVDFLGPQGQRAK